MIFLILAISLVGAGSIFFLARKNSSSSSFSKSSSNKDKNTPATPTLPKPGGPQSPIPKPPGDSPDSNRNKLTKYIVTKINDNTFKYRFTVNNDKQNCQGFDNVSYSNFINLLRTSQHPQYKEFFEAFQGALKDANSKFPAYF